MKKLSASIFSVVCNCRVNFFPNAGLKTTEWTAPSFAMRQQCRPLYIMRYGVKNNSLYCQSTWCHRPEFRCEKLKSLLRRIVTWLVRILWLVNCLLFWWLSQLTVAAMNRLSESCRSVMYRIYYGVCYSLQPISGVEMKSWRLRNVNFALFRWIIRATEGHVTMTCVTSQTE